MIKQKVEPLLISVALCCLGMPHLGLGDDSSSRPVLRNDLVEKGQFIQIPGPNPLGCSLVVWDCLASAKVAQVKGFG